MRLRSFLPVSSRGQFVREGSATTCQSSDHYNFCKREMLGAIADIQSDGFGSYFDGVEAVTTFLTTNGYNGNRLGRLAVRDTDSTTRKVSISFANPVQVANGGTAIPIRPSMPRM